MNNIINYNIIILLINHNIKLYLIILCVLMSTLYNYIIYNNEYNLKFICRKI